MALSRNLELLVACALRAGIHGRKAEPGQPQQFGEHGPNASNQFRILIPSLVSDICVSGFLDEAASDDFSRRPCIDAHALVQAGIWLCGYDHGAHAMNVVHQPYIPRAGSGNSVQFLQVVKLGERHNRLQNHGARSTYETVRCVKSSGSQCWAQPTIIAADGRKLTKT